MMENLSHEERLERAKDALGPCILGIARSWGPKGAEETWQDYFARVAIDAPVDSEEGAPFEVGMVYGASIALGMSFDELMVCFGDVVRGSEFTR